jgi:hypothetical protein
VGGVAVSDAGRVVKSDIRIYRALRRSRDAGSRYARGAGEVAVPATEVGEAEEVADALIDGPGSRLGVWMRTPLVLPQPARSTAARSAGSAERTTPPSPACPDVMKRPLRGDCTHFADSSCHHGFGAFCTYNDVREVDHGSGRALCRSQASDVRQRLAS